MNLKFKKIFQITLVFLSCLTSIFSIEFFIGSCVVLNSNQTEKASHAIDSLCNKKGSSFVNYEFVFENSNQKLNSHDFFKNEFNIETNSVMSNNDMYAYTKINESKTILSCENMDFNISSNLLFSNLGSCFDFESVLTRTALPKKRLGLSESLARKILNKNNSEKLDVNDVFNLSTKVVKINSEKIFGEFSIYCYYKVSSKNSYFNRYLYDDFIVYHDTEISTDNFNYVLTASPYYKKTKKLLETFSYENRGLIISLNDTDSKCYILNNDIISFNKNFALNDSVLILTLCFILAIALYCFFLLAKLKRKTLVFIICLIVIDFIKLIIFNNGSTTFLSLAFKTYFCYFVVLLLPLLLIGNKIKHE